MSEGYEIHEVYLFKQKKDIEEGKEIVCELMPLSTFSRTLVKAKIAKSSDELLGGEKLRVRKESGEVEEGRWLVKIIEELDPDEVKFDPETGSAVSFY